MTNSAAITRASTSTSRAPLPPLHWTGTFSGSGTLATKPDRRLSRHNKVGSVRDLEVSLTPTTKPGFYRVLVTGKSMQPLCGSMNRATKQSFRFERYMLLSEVTRGSLSGRSNSYPFPLHLCVDQDSISVSIPNFRTGNGEEIRSLQFRGTGSLAGATGQPLNYVEPRSTPRPPETPKKCGFPREHQAIERHDRGVDPFYAFGPPGTYTSPGFERALQGRSCAELALMRKRRVQENRNRLLSGNSGPSRTVWSR